jgi:hypothetical protein
MTATVEGPKGRMALGLVLIGLGFILLLEHAGILSIRGLGGWWPLLLIGMGVVKVRQPLEDGQRANGVALLLIGGMFQLMALLSFGKAWPLILIAFGAFLVWQGTRSGVPGATAAEAQSPHVSDLALMGGVKKSVRTPDFRGGYITAVMGGVDLDLRKSKIQTSPAVLDVVMFWGGIDLKVPSDWVVDSQITPIMGGFENKAQPLVDSDTAPRLIIRGWAIMGGGVVGN